MVTQNYIFKLGRAPEISDRIVSFLWSTIFFLLLINAAPFEGVLEAIQL
jgi:hypothetical protein